MSLVNVTPIAAEKISVLLKREQVSSLNTGTLRVAVIGGGCSGLQYRLGWDEVKEGDFTEEVLPGALVVVDEKSAAYLAGATLDYKESLMGAGFEINNPNAQSSCGCGKSFS